VLYISFDGNGASVKACCEGDPVLRHPAGGQPQGAAHPERLAYPPYPSQRAAQKVRPVARAKQEK
jgi:hypothetical protein